MNLDLFKMDVKSFAAWIYSKNSVAAAKAPSSKISFMESLSQIKQENCKTLHMTSLPHIKQEYQKRKGFKERFTPNKIRVKTSNICKTKFYRVT